MTNNQKILIAGFLQQLANNAASPVEVHALRAASCELTMRREDAIREAPSEAEMLEAGFPVMEGDTLDKGDGPVIDNNPTAGQPRKGKYQDDNENRVLNSGEMPR